MITLLPLVFMPIMAYLAISAAREAEKLSLQWYSRTGSMRSYLIPPFVSTYRDRGHYHMAVAYLIIIAFDLVLFLI